MKQDKYSEADILRLARRAYQHGTADFPIQTAQCALLVIDMQDEFVKPNWTPFWIPEATRIVPRVARLIQRCRKKKIPVIYTAFARTHQLLDRPLSGPLMPNRYPEIAGPPDLFREAKIWNELAPLPQELVLLKPSYGAFYDTPLETILKNLGRTQVIICGTMTNFCCGTTARQAYERGFYVIFGSDITATDDPDMQEWELRVIRKGFGRVLSCQEILDALK